MNPKLSVTNIEERKEKQRENSVLIKIQLDARLIKMSLTETYSRARVGKNVSDRSPIRNGLK